MRTLTALLSLPWIAVGIGFWKVIDEQGKLIGGSQYFVHMGMGSGVVAEYVLLFGSFVLSIWLLLLALKRTSNSRYLRYFSLFVALLVVMTYVGFIHIPIISLIASLMINTGYFPSGYAWVPTAALCLSIATAMLPSIPPVGNTNTQEQENA